MRDLLSAIGGGIRKVRNGTPVPFVSTKGGSLFGDMFGGAPDAERAFDAYGSVGTLFAIVTQLSTALASVNWRLYEKSDQRDEDARKEVLTHGFLKVWNRPNGFFTPYRLRQTVQQHLDLVGEGVIVLNKVGNIVLEMWPVRPDRIEPVKHPTKFLTGYIYTGPNGEEVPLTLDQVIHLKYPNPSDPYRGMGPVQTVLNDIDASRYSAQWNRNFFVNGARPGGIIKVDYRMSDKEFNTFVTRWRQQHQGVANAHRVAVLENAEWQDTAFSMSDMQFVELRNLPRELIREAFAFPKPMLGTVDDVNRANSDAAKEIMAEQHTIPRARLWKDEINTFMLPQFVNGETKELDYDDPTPVNHEARDRERDSQSASALDLVNAGFHPDDITEAMGLPRMRWVGIPSKPASATENDNKEGGIDANKSTRTTRRQPAKS